MNEAMLFITVIMVMISMRFITTRLKSPLLNYTRMLAAIGLLILIWIFSPESSVGPKLILSGLALTTIGRELFDLRKTRVHK